jgi:hypothetical protein
VPAPHRFVRDKALDLGDHGQGAVVIGRAFRDTPVIHHRDYGVVMDDAGQVPDALGHLLGRHPGIGGGRLANSIRHRDVHGGVGADLAHCQIESRETAGRLTDLHRERHATEITLASRCRSGENSLPRLAWRGSATSQVSDHGRPLPLRAHRRSRG